MPYSHNPTVDQAVEKIKHAGRRVTQARIATIEVLVAAHEPLTIEQVHKAITVKSDLVTAYRNLDTLAQEGIARRSLRPDGVATYELQTNREREFWVTSETDFKRQKLPIELSAELNTLIARIEHSLARDGYSSVTSMVEFFGTPKPLTAK